MIALPKRGKLLSNFILCKGPFNIYVNKERWVGGQSNVYYYKVNTLFHLLCLFTRGRWVFKKGQSFVYVNIEWPLRPILTIPMKILNILNDNFGRVVAMLLVI